MSDFKCIQLAKKDDAHVVRFLDERVMDAERIELLGRELFSLGQDEPNPRLVLDFSDVRFFSSAAINKLIVMEKRLRARGGRLGLCRLSPTVRDLFGFTHLDELFGIHETEEQALAALKD